MINLISNDETMNETVMYERERGKRRICQGRKNTINAIGFKI